MNLLYSHTLEHTTAEKGNGEMLWNNLWDRLLSDSAKFRTVYTVLPFICEKEKTGEKETLRLQMGENLFIQTVKDN